MSAAFSSARPRSKGEVTQQTIQKVKEKQMHLDAALLLRVWMGVCVSASGAEKVTPVANIRRNGNWYVSRPKV